MNRFHTTGVIIVTIFFSYSFAENNAVENIPAAKPSYVWTESSGLLPAGPCESKTLTTPPLKSMTATSMTDLSDDVIEITDLPEVLSQSHPGLIGSFWQATTKDGQAITAHCSQTGTSGVLYEVHIKNSLTEPLLVVAAPKSSLFHFVRTHTSEEAELLLESENRAPSSVLTEGVPSFEGAFATVFCEKNSENKIFSEDLKTVLFTINAYENVQLVQSWSANQKFKDMNGEKVSFVKVQIPQTRGDAKVGWAIETLIRPRSECMGNEPIKSVASRATSWLFPTIKRATQNYKTGMRRFKAGRSGGRLHAACDLYRVKGETVVAVTGGTVIRDRYYFYEGTYALEIKHDGGKVVRYGEVTGSAASGVSIGKSVKAGQTVGFVGKVNSNCCEPMLHFELYSGTKTGSLTQSGNSFRRRSDLLDPSAYLTDWEKAKFGTNY